MSDGLTLYVGEKNVSSWSMRPWVWLHHKGLAFEERTISLVEDKDRSKRRQVSPTGRVPVLHHRGRIVPDSLAIMEYVEELWGAPNYPSLWPSDIGDRAWARWLACTMHSGFTTLRQRMSFNLCFLPKRPDPGAEALGEAQEMLTYFEESLSETRAGGPFLFGAFSGVDAMYAPAVVRLIAFEVPTSKTP